MLNSLKELFFETGFCYVDWRMLVMWMVVAVLMYLAVYRQYEPLLLVPIAFGALIANLPTEGVINKPATYLISPVDGIVNQVYVKEGDSAFVPRMVKQIPTRIADVVKTAESAQADIQSYLNFVEDMTSKSAREDVFKKAKGVPDLMAFVSPGTFTPKRDAEKAIQGKKFLVKFKGKETVVDASSMFVWAQSSGKVTEVAAKAGWR